ncbi:MAG: hypothetical protein CMJ80_06200 [Planctomycetaceae bacterium]|nr:hypothetical protein [Planctomycetaceae bacterium]
MNRSNPPQRNLGEFDPTYLNALRETKVIIALFAVFCVWSVCVCYTYGYISPEETVDVIPTVWGIPSWVFWGILLPWLAVDVVAVWFCFFYMKVDDLGEAHEDEDLTEQIAHLNEEESERD